MKELLEQENISICIALGFFDCVHVAHRKIINSMISYAKKNNSKSAVFTFKDQGITSFKNKLIYTYNERVSILKNMGVDYVIPFVFDENCKNMKWEDFLSLLFSKASVKAVFCGYDYTFGHKGEGSVELLKKYCNKIGVEVYVLPAVYNDNNEIVSSSFVKRLIAEGNIVEANSLLCDNYFIESKIIKGRGEGHLFGIPTANSEISLDKILPKSGVYATITTVDGKKYTSVTNVGKKPTFLDDTDSVETLIGAFCGDLYGKTIRVEFVKYLREVSKFDSPLQLKEQIMKDLQWRK